MLLLLACAAPIDSSIEPEAAPIHVPTIQVDRGACETPPQPPYLGGSVMITICDTSERCTAGQQWRIVQGNVVLSSCSGGATWEVLQMVP